MTLKTLTDSWNAIKAFTVSNKTEILTGLGLAGAWVAVGLGIAATPKAKLKIDELRREKAEAEEPVTQWDEFKVAAPCYIPTVGVLITASACILYAMTENHRHVAALAAAYSMTDKRLEDLQKKVVDTVGESKAREINDDIAKDKLKEADKSALIYAETKASGETYPCYDAMFGQSFRANTNFIKAAVNRINDKMLHESFVSVNEFFDELGLKYINIGNHLGWDIDRGLLEVDYTYDRDDAGNPCLVITYEVTPQWIP